MCNLHVTRSSRSTTLPVAETDMLVESEMACHEEPSAFVRTRGFVRPSEKKWESTFFFEHILLRNRFFMLSGMQLPFLGKKL